MAQSMGSLVSVGAIFPIRLAAPGPPWDTVGSPGPPLHTHLHCQIQVATRGLPVLSRSCLSCAQYISGLGMVLDTG